MAKRTSKKASSPESIKKGDAVKKSIVSENNSAEAVEEKAVKLRSKSKKTGPAISRPAKSKKKAAVVDLADMEKSKIASRKAARGAKVKAGKGEPIKKPSTAGNGKMAKGSQPAVRKATTLSAVKPALRAVYSNSKYTLLVLGFGSDFQTKKSMVIFSDLLNGQVYTIALSVWNRWKLREVKKINTET